MANYNFRKDLILGNQGEIVIKEFLESMGGTFIEFNNDNKYDLKMIIDEIEATYEIKTDVYCTPTKDTGNMFIEFFCRDKPSGILTSQAKWFIMYYKYLNEAWFITTDDLKKLVNDNKFKVITNGGDKGSSTNGYLIPREKYKEFFKIYQLNG